MTEDSKPSSSPQKKRFAKKGWKFLGLDGQDIIRYFFGGNAILAIFILVLICAFLLREAAGFFPEHHRGLQSYRHSGIEFYDTIDRTYQKYKIWRGGIQRAFSREYQAPSHEVGAHIQAYESLLTHLKHKFKSDFKAYQDLLKMAKEEGDSPRITELSEKFSLKIKREAKEELGHREVSRLKELRGFSESQVSEMVSDIIANLPEVRKGSSFLKELEEKKKEIDAQSWADTSYLNQHFLTSKKISRDWNKLWKEVFKHSIEVRNDANTSFTVPNRIKGQLGVGLAKAQKVAVREDKLEKALEELKGATQYIPAAKDLSISILQRALNQDVIQGSLPNWFETGTEAQWKGWLAEVSQSEGDKMNSKQKEAFLKLATLPQNDDRLRFLGESAHRFVSEFPFDEESGFIYKQVDRHAEIMKQLKVDLEILMNELPAQLADPEAQKELNKFKKGYPAIVASFDEVQQELSEWQHDRPYSFFRSLGEFFLGKKWTNNSSTQDRYGLLPLFVGSMIISGIAILVAVPVSISAAVYVNQIAGSRAREFFKPMIEFIGAIPSIVLGFFGIAVLGQYLKTMGDASWLSWLPGLPMESRLNMLTAGLLLAFMASPTIFTLAEDALRNVPKAFSEGSLALGATKLETALRVIFPAASSGIVAAVLLGFGRVIGETMVVLLVAGNRISLPDFSEGIGVVTQPSHTMTGMIAQGLGEAPVGSVGYRALFMIGFVLFMISLVINYFAQKVVSKYQRT